MQMNYDLAQIRKRATSIKVKRFPSGDRRAHESPAPR
jgi:hypothetical protein